MFTGLIQKMGTVKSMRPNASGMTLEISTCIPTSQISIDDSVSVNGVCLTATNITEDGFEAQVVHVTLEKTNLGKLKVGDALNLELALRLGDRLGGHLVQGHVNGRGTLRSRHTEGDNHLLWLDLPQELMKFTMDEGSITLDGISLTIAATDDCGIAVSIIPHTFDVTNIQYRKIGDSLNVEVDVLAKYVANLMKHQNAEVIFE